MRIAFLVVVALLCYLVSGTAELPSTPVKADEHYCHSTGGCALQQTGQQFSLPGLKSNCMAFPFHRHFGASSTDARMGSG